MPPPNTVNRDLYLEWRSPRVGQANPERMTNPVWQWLAREPELSAYQANQVFDGPSSFGGAPAWCCMRFGQSRTELSDGRVVRIAGEHEDYYDPDFYIYNDVIVEELGGEISIYGYPHEVFGPTDFHSATLVGDAIFIIGNLSYIDRRRIGETPVVRLDTRSWAMTPASTDGTPPGWIHRHSASLADNHIVVTGGMLEIDQRHAAENPDDWSLDLTTLRWTRLTDRRWQQWELRRADGTGNNLWRRDMAYSFGGGEKFDPWLFEGLGDRDAVLAQRELHETRYSPPVPHEKLPATDDTPIVVRRLVESVVVRYVEDAHAVRVVVEGVLDARLVDTLLDDACTKLAALEGIAFTKNRVT
jgi:hypothetical protein